MTDPSVKNRNRILIILPDAKIGGAQTLNLCLANLLNTRGWLVDIVYIFGRSDLTYYKESFPGVTQVCLFCDSYARRIFLPLLLSQLSRRYDLILAGLDLSATNYGYIASVITNKPFIAWVHTSFHEYSKTVSFISRTISLWIYRNIDIIVFPSVGAKDSLLRSIGEIKSKSGWKQISNFIPPQGNLKPVDTHLTERIFRHPVVISVGRLVESKAYDRLIAIHRKLITRGNFHHLVILGDGPQRPALESLAKEVGVEDSVFLPGHVPNVQSWLRMATIFAMCSKYEGLPLVLLEALQSGIPIVAMDCPSGPREILNDGKNGLLVPYGDEIEFENSIALLLTNPALAHSFAKRGKLKLQEFLHENIIPLWEDLLTETINKANTGGVK